MKIVSIQPSSIDEVWDIEVQDDHSYVGNGIVHHNSSSKPNMQNIPTKGAGVVRAIFIPDKDEDWYSLDYSQVEYRLMAHYALGKGSDALRETYIGNPKVDFHQQMADLTGLARKDAKTLVFGLLYGMGKEKLAIGLKKDMAEAEEIFKVFHKNAPFVKTTSAMASQKARVRGYVYTLLKRRRRFPNGVSVHKALNALLQGSAADIMKKAMVDISKSGVEDVLGAPLLTVHDELDFSAPRTKLGKEAILEVKNMMINTFPLSVPLLVDVERGTNWANICPEAP